MPLIENRVIEKDLRDYLNEIGYNGRSAHFERLELVGIQRPGWLQLFAFEVQAKRPDDVDSSRLFGVCLDDERSKRFEVHLAANETSRDIQLDAWSENMITLKKKAVETLPMSFVFLFALVLVAIGTAALVIQLGGS